MDTIENTAAINVFLGKFWQTSQTQGKEKKESIMAIFDLLEAFKTFFMDYNDNHQ